MRDCKNLSRQELERKLSDLKDLLEDVTEERTLVLGQGNLHLSSHLVTKYADEIEKIKKNIETTEKLLKEI